MCSPRARAALEVRRSEQWERDHGFQREWRGESACPLSLFTGSKPPAAHFRVWGCVGYFKVHNPITKMADRAVRGIHLGSVPHGYRMLDPAMRKVSVAAHVRFVEGACPGVVVTREGLGRRRSLVCR